MEENKFDMKHSNEVIEQMNREIKEVEEKILKNKTPEEQEKIKKQWEQNRIETEEKTKKELEKFEREREKLKKQESELIPIEDIKEGLNGIVKDLDDKWNEAMQSAIGELSKGKTDEEKGKIMDTFNNINSNNLTKISERMKNAQFLLRYDNSSQEHSAMIIIADDYIYTNIKDKINEFVDKEKSDRIKQISLDSTNKIKAMEKEKGEVSYYKDLLIDDINIRNNDRYYNLSGKVADNDIKSEYDNLVNNILKILEVDTYNSPKVNVVESVMSSVEKYRKENEIKSINELILERVRLFSEIAEYEEKYIIDKEEFVQNNDVKSNLRDVYNMNNLYLKEITNIIAMKSKNTSKTEDNN